MTYTVDTLKSGYEAMLSRIDKDINEVETFIKHIDDKYPIPNAYIDECVLHPLDRVSLYLSKVKSSLKVVIKSCEDLTDKEVD